MIGKLAVILRANAISMLKLLILFGGLFLSQITFCQEYSYTFSLTEVSNPGDAKESIDKMRDVLGVNLIKFDDETDRFEIITRFDFLLEEMRTKLETNGVLVSSEISKINIE
jgi:hypothetical protein